MKEHQLEFATHRSPVVGTHGTVASSQPLATAAGLAVLQKGGNAVDAAVATAAALNVTEPGSTGLGGDAFCLIYNAESRQVYSLNASGRAPLALSLERLKKEGINSLPARHPYNVTVPGACAGWCDAVSRYGRLDMAEVLAPAIKLAEEGFPVAPITAHGWQASARLVLSKSLNGLELTINGRGPQAGEIFRNPGLARTMRKIAEGGKQAFYQGDIAESIASIVQEAGGVLTVEDLAAHESTWVDPISVDYRGIRVWECPPNGQGIAALMALSILSGYDLTQYDPLSPERYHLEIEAMRLAFADARRYVTDPTAYNIPVSQMLSESYAAERRKLISMNSANQEVQHGYPAGRSDTVYLSVVDGEGNACSFINSVYMGFGSAIVPYGLGFALQNRGANFNLDPDHPNALAPGKRPYHTIIPAMATYAADNKLYASFGVMGGFMQPQGHMQVTVGMVDDQLDPQSVLDRPRFCIQANTDLGLVSLEEGIPVKTMAALAELGHRVKPISGYGRYEFGKGQIIWRDPQSGVLWAGSDPRSDGCAMTLL